MQIQGNQGGVAHRPMLLKEQYLLFRAIGTVNLIFSNYFILNSAAEQLEKGRVKHNPTNFFFGFLYLNTILQIATLCFMDQQELRASLQNNTIHKFFDNTLKFVLMATLATMAASEIFSSNFPQNHTYTKLTALSIIPVVFLNEARPLRYIGKNVITIINALAVGMLAYAMQNKSQDVCHNSKLFALSHQMSECIQIMETQRSFILPKCHPIMDFGISLGTFICGKDDTIPLPSCLSQEGRNYMRLHEERMEAIYTRFCPSDAASIFAFGVLLTTWILFMRSTPNRNVRAARV